MTAIDIELRAAIKAAIKDTLSAYEPGELDDPRYVDKRGRTPLDRLADQVINLGRCHPGETL